MRLSIPATRPAYFIRNNIRSTRQFASRQIESEKLGDCYRICCLAPMSRKWEWATLYYRAKNLILLANLTIFGIELDKHMGAMLYWIQAGGGMKCLPSRGSRAANRQALNSRMRRTTPSLLSPALFTRLRTPPIVRP